METINFTSDQQLQLKNAIASRFGLMSDHVFIDGIMDDKCNPTNKLLSAGWMHEGTSLVGYAEFYYNTQDPTLKFKVIHAGIDGTTAQPLPYKDDFSIDDQDND
jgi:hypothetical protein